LSEFFGTVFIESAAPGDEALMQSKEDDWGFPAATILEGLGASSCPIDFRLVLHESPCHT
jgi:hypothetical protein